MDCYPLPSLTKRPCMLDMVLAELLAQCGILTDEQIVWAVARAGKVGHTLGGVLKEALCLSALQLFSLRRLAVRYLNDADALDWYLSRIRSLLGYGLTRCNLEPSRDSARLAA